MSLSASRSCALLYHPACLVPPLPPPLSAMSTILDLFCIRSCRSLASSQEKLGVKGAVTFKQSAGLKGQSHLSNQLVSNSKFLCCLGGNLRQAFSTAAMYCHFGEYSGTTAKFVSLASSDICASVSGLDDKSLLHLTLVSSRADETRWENVVDVVLVIVAVVISVLSVGV